MNRRRTDILDVGEPTLYVGEQTVGETTRRRNDRLPSQDIKRTFLLILILLFVPNKFLIFRRQSIMKKAKSIVASLELFDQLSIIIDHRPTTINNISKKL